jgi:hypothetical protein
MEGDQLFVNSQCILSIGVMRGGQWMLYRIKAKDHGVPAELVDQQLPGLSERVVSGMLTASCTAKKWPPNCRTHGPARPIGEHETPNAEDNFLRHL